ncbi:Uncharacterized protein Adt_10596 [Abeliophyllum distichum]|uniref:Retrotransposon gag domain-containing protein n=1 Tax=Abeliophyllum distichum TaxID=126358 RepID=A0ABD1UKM9_9LAMI
MLRTQGGILETFDPEIERTFRRRCKEHNQKQKAQKQIQMADEQIRREIEQQAARVAAMEAARLAAHEIQQQEEEEEDDGDDGNMPMAQFLTPAAAPDRSSIVYPAFGRNDFQLRADLINLFSNHLQFYGKTNENPNTHLSRFLRMCHNFQFQGVNEDAIRLRLFPYTLRDGALEWLDSEPHASITTWDDLARKFCNKYFSPAKVAKMKLEISTFQQLDGERYHEAWDRFKELLRKCPNHGIKKGLQAQYFYSGLSSQSKSIVDSSANGSIANKNVNEA